MRDQFHTAYVNAAFSYAMDVGSVVSFLASSEKYSAAPLAPVVHLVNSAIALRQCKIFHDSDGHTAAIIIWGWLSPYTMSMRSQQGVFTLPLAEWNEGEQLCILEMICKKYIIEEVVNEFLQSIAAGEHIFFTHPRLASRNPSEFTKWKHVDSKKLIRHLEAQV